MTFAKLQVNIGLSLSERVERCRLTADPVVVVVDVPREVSVFAVPFADALSYR